MLPPCTHSTLRCAPSWTGWAYCWHTQPVQQQCQRCWVGRSLAASAILSVCSCAFLPDAVHKQHLLAGRFCLHVYWQQNHGSGSMSRCHSHCLPPGHHSQAAACLYLSWCSQGQPVMSVSLRGRAGWCAWVSREQGERGPSGYLRCCRPPRTTSRQQATLHTCKLSVAWFTSMSHASRTCCLSQQRFTSAAYSSCNRRPLTTHGLKTWKLADVLYSEQVCT